MFLKRIELSGFKSFADRTELEFVPGITAVVGPNGSGKSNISDSIRWVLGEQSARSLRGGNMQDVIFAGSDTRGAVNFSEVSLTLDNEDQKLPLDFSEVTVTRRLHRSGESEYFINKQACRLRDITELFMDTGIGKEAYSIIGQGRIEEILSTRSEDRRGIFEEASGIVKYKTRKKEAEKKLEATEQNLVRIFDLIHELEDQIEPLEEQAEKAKKYKQWKEELKQHEVSLYVGLIEKLHGQWTTSSQKLEALQHEHTAMATRLNVQDAQLEEERSKARQLEHDLELLQADLLEWSQEAEKAEGRIQVLQERKSNLKREQHAGDQSADSLAERLQQYRNERAQAREKAEQIRKRIEETERLRDEEQARWLGSSGEAISKTEDELKGDLLELLNEMAQKRNEIRYIEQQHDNVDKQLTKLVDEENAWKEKKARLIEDARDAAERAQQVEDDMEQARQQYAGIGEQINEKRHLLDEAMLTVRKWQQKRDALVSRRDTMQELQDDYDGFFQGVREVLRNADRPGGIQGVHGAVAELIKVGEKLEVAIETALGSALQHIVMEDEASSREAITFLKKRQLGRATFLPMDVIRGRRMEATLLDKAKEQDGFIGVAAELVDYDHEYESIVFNLLGQVILAQDLSSANRIAAQCKYRYRIVTLEGDIVHAGGSMTGGSIRKKSANLLSRQRVIDQLEEEIRQSEARLQHLQAKTDGMKKELETLSEQLESMRLAGEQKRLEQHELRSRVEQLDNEIKEIDQRLNTVEAGAIEWRAEQADLRNKQEAAEQALVVLQQQETELKQEIERAESERRARESAKEEMQSKMTEWKVELAALRQELQSCESEIDRIEGELEAGEEQLRQQNEAKGELVLALRLNEEELIAARERLNEANIRKEECRNRIDALRSERADKHRRLEAEEQETKQERERLAALESRMHETEVAVNRLDVELDNVLRKLAEEYELSFELARERFEPPHNEEQAQADVRELKRRISLLGEVNLGAIDEFERVSERHRFLNEQRNDLTEAKATLHKVIHDMETEMAERFNRTFQDIREQFGAVFSRLFGGGRADLVLTDPERPLDTGVDIIAQPPGKKLQNMQLLSGGERALTAIALLFAILHIKPVPFCVLDEVEAALDEANVTRFAEYLREFSQQTQFIVVTHRKGTMEEADVLYGVAMEEDGVSKLVSVRLEDGEAVSA